MIKILDGYIYRTLTLALMLICIPVLFPSEVTAGGIRGLQKSSLSNLQYLNRIIVKYRDTTLANAVASGEKYATDMAHTRASALSARAGLHLSHHRIMSGNGHVLNLPGRMTEAEAEAVATRLKADPNVEYAEPDLILFPMLVPNDPQYANQWHYKAPSDSPGGANLPGAWDLTTGSSSIVVAVIDTGILLSHADITGRTVQGYNFISDATSAGNGVGRSTDPSDLGDWVVANDCYSGSPAEDSSWHGTHVTGTISASTNNSVGVAGINWTSKILPVRVLGKCGGSTSDIVDGMRWAAGISVAGVPANANPANVLNMSLGGSGACGTTFQNAINDVIAAGTTVVVAAGNSNANVSNHSPANCNSVISVASVGPTGGRAYYSNYGTGVKIAAPGGDTTLGASNGVLSTLNSGTTVPVSDTYQYYQGTSMATPHVAGIISLMLSVNSSLTPSQVLTYIQASARVFPTGTASDCTTSICGAGIIDASAAVRLLLYPSVTTAAVTGISTTAAASGGNVTTIGPAVTARGVCWNTSGSPTTADNCTNDGTGVGSYTSAISGLTGNTTYHVRAYATNSYGTSYGNDVSFITLMPTLPIITTTHISGITFSSATSGGMFLPKVFHLLAPRESAGALLLTRPRPITVQTTEAAPAYLSVPSQA